MAFEMRPFNNSFFDMKPGDVFKDFGRPFFSEDRNQMMKTDITEHEDSYMVEAELPGMNKEDINIEFDRGILTISGKQSVDNEATDDEGKVIHRERSVSNIKRQFSFENIEEAEIDAKFDNGILNITLQKTQNKGSLKRIEIK